MYNDDDGVEDFSEGSEEAIAKTNVIDDGSLVLDPSQIDDAYKQACDLSLTQIGTVGYTLSEVAPAPSVPALAAASNKKRAGTKAEGGGSESDTEDDVAPMQRTLGQPSSTKDSSTPKKAKAKCGDRDSPVAIGKSLDKCRRAATKFVEGAKVVDGLHSTLEAEVPSLVDDLQKLLAESKLISVNDRLDFS